MIAALRHVLEAGGLDDSGRALVHVIETRLNTACLLAEPEWIASKKWLGPSALLKKTGTEEE